MTVIIDYGAGNTASLFNAVRDITPDVTVTSDREIIKKAERIILPGVGQASAAMRNLIKTGITEVLRETKVPFLGICLGMQLMGKFSEEGEAGCLGLLDFTVRRLPADGIRVPHMGWSKIYMEQESVLLRDIPVESYFYFAHSYIVPLTDYTIASAECGSRFSAVIGNGSRYGIQFHPEKSGKQGLQIIRNFLTI